MVHNKALVASMKAQTEVMGFASVEYTQEPAVDTEGAQVVYSRMLEDRKVGHLVY